MYYLDNSATTRVLKPAADKAFDVMTHAFGNPSSLHRLGTESGLLLEEARGQIAASLSVTKNEVYFTSGGSESINTAIFGVCQKMSRFGKHIITTAFEHAAVLNCMKRLESRGFEVTYLKPDRHGHISPSQLQKALRADTILVSCMLINNEVGAVVPVWEMGAILRGHRAIFHVDAVQAFGKIDVLPKKIGCHLLSMSGHKIGAPKGVGALFIDKTIKIEPFLYGGGQERGFRGGTEALPNIAAFGLAAFLRKENGKESFAAISRLRALAQERILCQFPFAKIHSVSDFPYILSLSLPGCKSEVMMRVLEDRGVYVSSGSACAKGKHSHVLKAMGLDGGLIDSALRISFCPESTEEDIAALLDGLCQGVALLRR